MVINTGVVIVLFLVVLRWQIDHGISSTEKDKQFFKTLLDLSIPTTLDLKNRGLI